MSNTVIQVENLSKQYRLGTVGTGTISHDINRWWHKVRGKEDPFLTVGEENNRAAKGTTDYVWALRDIAFDVKQGEVLGIIGRNGAGKSTLLKLLSRTTAPTTGNIKVKGRIASLLEVGTGFHPELTGRENIFLNGAILGMTKHEIIRKFDEIVDFAGVERYIDTPVKRYSSGMYVRLAFGVAAHLDSEIMIVDEVLAVGDAEFQKKCFGKMGDLSKGGRTVLFVSHQLGMLSKLCRTSILLEKGKIAKSGYTTDILDHYLSATNENSTNVYKVGDADFYDKNCFIEEAATVDKQGKIVEQYSFDDEIVIKLSLQVTSYTKNTLVGIGLQDRFNTRVCTFFKPLYEIMQDGKDSSNLKVTIPARIIAPNTYSFIFALFEPTGRTIHIVENACPIRIVDTGTEFSIFEGVDYGNFIINANWEH